MADVAEGLQVVLVLFALGPRELHAVALREALGAARPGLRQALLQAVDLLLALDERFYALRRPERLWRDPVHAGLLELLTLLLQLLARLRLEEWDAAL